MAAMDDMLRAQQKTNELLEQIIEGNIGVGGGRGTNRRTSTSRRLSIRDFEKIGEDHVEKMRKIYSSAEEENMSNLQKYYRYKEEYAKDQAKLQAELNELQEEYNSRLEETTRLKQELEDGTISEEGMERLKDALELEKEIYSVREEGAALSVKSAKMSKTDAIISDLEKIKNNVKGIYGEIRKLTDPWAKADHAASKYAKTIGMAKKGMDELRHTALVGATKRNIGSFYNMTTDELIAAQTNYSQKVGRNLKLDYDGMEDMAAMHAVMGEKGNDLAAKFESFGVSMSDTAKHAGKMFADASKSGLSFEKYTDNVAQNIKIAQNYTFKNGLKGLEGMAKKATALKIDMQQVANFADKVMTVEGAIDVASKLQVLGGSFAAIADPISMMNESMLDMEGLTDRITSMVKGKGVFNKETGELTIGAHDKRLIKQAAEATGISYDNLMEQAQAHARRDEISKQIKSSTSASQLNEDMQELLKNTATFKDGKAGVTIDGQFKSIDELKNDDYEQLVKETQSESADIKDIAKNVRSLVDTRSGLSKSWNNIKARMFSWLGASEKGVTKGLGSQVAKPLLFGGVALGGAFSAYKMFRYGKGIVDIIKGFGRGTAGGAGNGIGGNMMSRLFSRGTAGGAGNGMGGNMMSRLFGNTVRNGANNTASNLASNVVTKQGSQIIKGNVGRTAKRAVIKTFGKTGAQKAVGIGAKLATGAASGMGLGIIGAVGDIATDALVDSGKIKKGGGAHHAMKAASGAASGAALGMAIGSIIPGIGTAIGGAIGAVGGAVVGLVKAGKAKQEAKLDEKIGEMGIERKGNYNRKKLKEINKALERGDGKISNRLRRKLKKEGDYELLDKLDEMQIARNKKEADLMESKRKLKESKRGKKGISKKRIQNAVFNVEHANFGGKGMGMGFGSSIAKGRGKKVLSALNPATMPIKFFKGGKNITKKLKDTVGVTIEGLKEKGLSGAWEAIKVKREENSEKRSGRRDESVNNRDFNININGTLKLTGDNGQSVDIIELIKKDKTLLTSLSSMISNEIKRMSHGSDVSRDF